MLRITERLFWNICVAVLLVLSVTGTAAAVEIGENAPDFTLPSTSGKNLSLSDFRGKKSVLIEFYVADAGVT